jgi:glycosyltransferase involved in cell wall biosynthesis
LSDVVDIKILVDDSSKDQTALLSRKLGVQTFVHDANYGYGRNQQTCYREALAAGADIVVMVHPDYQYTPSLVPAMAGMVASGVYDMVLGSRILGGRVEGRNAASINMSPTGSSPHFKISFSASSSRSTTPDSAPFRASCLRRCPCLKTPTISSSTTR